MTVLVAKTGVLVSEACLVTISGILVGEPGLLVSEPGAFGERSLLGDRFRGFVVDQGFGERARQLQC